MRIEHYVLNLPLAIKRFFGHLWSGLRAYSRLSEFSLKRTLFWLVEMLFLVIDLLPVSFLFESILDLVKKSNRGLNEQERILATEVFGPEFPVNLVVLNERPWFWPIKRVKAFVFLHTINSYGQMKEQTLIHELTHVWQYREMGSVYIPRALKAQQSEEGYNYNPSDIKVRDFSDFNLEQQAEIVANNYLNLSIVQIRASRRPEIPWV